MVQDSVTLKHTYNTHIHTQRETHRYTDTHTVGEGDRKTNLSVGKYGV